MSCQIQNSQSRASDILFVDNQLESIKLLLAGDYNSRSLTLAKGNPEHLDKKFSVFVLFLEVSRIAVVCGYISVKILNLLTLLFQKKKIVCIIFVGS